MKKTIEKKWWHHAIGYQIYPKSFQDSNGDGVGDLRGIMNRLDYLKELGVDLLWLCPVFRSPMMDHGYDISDYESIDPCFGSNQDMTELIASAKERGMKILLDLVINHTSDEHPWFQEAMKDLDGKYGKYYIIQEGVDEEPPNNWGSIFGGSAWEKIEGTNRYYLHLFTKGQPDLNWENAELRQELYDMINRWLEQGLGGFRVDAISHIKKNFNVKKHSQEKIQKDHVDTEKFVPAFAAAWEYYNNVEGLNVWLDEMKEKTFKLHDCFTVAEMDDVDPEELKAYIGEDGYFSSIFDFCHTSYRVQEEPWCENPHRMVEELKEKLFHRQDYAKNHGFLCNFMENHDQPRSIPRFIPEKYINVYSQSLLGTVNFFLRGIPFLYQGQEIGMKDYKKKTISEYKDLATYKKYAEYMEKGMSPENALKRINTESREHSRTPMQWDDTNYAGFTTGTPWFEVNPNYKEINVASQQKDKNSLLNYYKKMIALRNIPELNDCFVYGDTVQKHKEHQGVIAYERVLEKQRVLVIANCNSKECILPWQNDAWEVLLNNYGKVTIVENEIALKEFQVVVFNSRQCKKN